MTLQHNRNASDIVARSTDVDKAATLQENAAR